MQLPDRGMIQGRIERLRSEQRGYNLNPDQEMLETLIEGYLANEMRYGYPACPCRLASGNFEEDKDIICPCDYRDDDISEHGACYCSLYVDDDIASGKREPTAIPERRPPEEARKVAKDKPETNGTNGAAVFTVSVNVWRCPVCGYLAAKDQPPPKCPICGATRERFELFIEAR